MMQAQFIQTTLEAQLPGAHIQVSGDDGQHFQATIVASQFEGLSRVKRQQLVYQALGQYIESGELHALSLKTMTPAEHQQQES